MQEVSREGQGDTLNAVYVLLRVYNIGQSTAAVQLLVDPERMRLAGELIFTPEHWSVKPSPQYT